MPHTRQKAWRNDDWLVNNSHGSLCFIHAEYNIKKQNEHKAYFENCSGLVTSHWTKVTFSIPNFSWSSVSVASPPSSLTSEMQTLMIVCCNDTESFACNCTLPLQQGDGQQKLFQDPEQSPSQGRQHLEPKVFKGDVLCRLDSYAPSCWYKKCRSELWVFHWVGE